MAQYELAYKIGRKNEGGYVNSPSTDKGGETYCGISRNFFPDWIGWSIVDAHKPLKRYDIIDDPVLEQHIFEFYKANKWDKIKGDGIMSNGVATYFYDWTLTSGGAIKKVQNELGVSADGIFGNGSLSALNDKGSSFLTQLHNLRVGYYRHIVDNDPNQSVNLAGWLNRANDTFEYAKSLG